MSIPGRLLYCWFGLLPNLPHLLQSDNEIVCLLNLPNVVTATFACHRILAKSSLTRSSLNACRREGMRYACIKL